MVSVAFGTCLIADKTLFVKKANFDNLYFK